MSDLRLKMLAVMDDVRTQVAERDELIELIAIALLTRKNLFILGDTGQAKSYAINEFRKRITGAKQFERLMSKQVDEEQLFGRLDLSSLIPGHMSHGTLMEDPNYKAFYNQSKKHYEDYSISGEELDLIQAHEMAEKMKRVAGVLYALSGSKPKINVSGKIPDSHICFLDEIFKANDGILNSLLTALNERVYTNEGQTVDIPVISFFSASNEIPDFNDPAEKILKPLYDRFELKCVTEYVADKANRLSLLAQKQNVKKAVTPVVITLQELVGMYYHVGRITIPDAINELMDDVLCELRRKGIHVSDRKYFNYAPIVQAVAWLRGGSEVSSSDLLYLKHYLWTKPEERTEIDNLLYQMCKNPIHSKAVAVTAMADECFSDLKDNQDNKRALMKFRTELVRLYTEVLALEMSVITDNDKAEIANAVKYLEEINKNGHEMCKFTHTPLEELKQLQ